METNTITTASTAVQDQPTGKQRGLSIEYDVEKFAMSLKTFRLRKNLSQKELGQKWGCSRYTIMRIETGKRITWEMMYKVYNQLLEAIAQEARELALRQ